MNDFPETLEEWGKYIKALSDEDLFNQAEIAGSGVFSVALREEGMTPQFIHDVLVIFAKEFDLRQIEPPGRANGCYIDFRRILQPIPSGD